MIFDSSAFAVEIVFVSLVWQKKYFVRDVCVRRYIFG